MDDKYNYKLCEDRHKRIPKEFEKVWIKIKQLENRFLVILTLLIANLLGVVAVLIGK